MTADHVIWEGEEISPHLQIFYEGLSYSVTDVLYANPDTHIAVLQIPELAFEENLTYVSFAETSPETGEAIVAIGYPNTAAEQVDVFGQKLLTPGLMGATRIDSMIRLATELEGVPSAYTAETSHAFHLSSARVFKGDSGGAYLNQHGELYGITCYMDQKNLISYAASVIPAETLDPELKALLSEIAALQ
jgi:S1-C subfamily serine protease